MNQNPYEAPQAVLGDKPIQPAVPIDSNSESTVPRKGRMRSDLLMRRGIMYFFGGLLVSLVTFALASGNGGGPYILAWGPVLIGPVIYFRGLALKGSPGDYFEADEPPPINRADGKCPSCQTAYASNQDYCKLCGRYLKA